MHIIIIFIVQNEHPGEDISMHRKALDLATDKKVREAGCHDFVYQKVVLKGSTLAHSSSKNYWSFDKNKSIFGFYAGRIQYIF